MKEPHVHRETKEITQPEAVIDGPQETQYPWVIPTIKSGRRESEAGHLHQTVTMHS